MKDNDEKQTHKIIIYSFAIYVLVRAIYALSLIELMKFLFQPDAFFFSPIPIIAPLLAFLLERHIIDLLLNDRKVREMIE